MRRPRFVPKRKWFSLPRDARRGWAKTWGFMYTPGVPAALFREFYSGGRFMDMVAVSNLAMEAAR